MTQRVHLADLANHIGWLLREPTRDRTVKTQTISGVKTAGFEIIVGLDRVEKTVSLDAPIKLWRPQDKIAHLRCGCRKAHEQVGVTVEARQLAEHVGWLAFVETSGSPGPHLILQSEVQGDNVRLVVSSQELVGTFEQLVEVDRPVKTLTA